MNHKQINLTVLGLDIAFRQGANMERAQIAAKLVEDRYADQKSRLHAAQSKDILLTFLALELADELLQIKTRQGEANSRIKTLLAKIEKSF